MITEADMEVCKRIAAAAQARLPEIAKARDLKMSEKEIASAQADSDWRITSEGVVLEFAYDRRCDDESWGHVEIAFTDLLGTTEEFVARQQELQREREEREAARLAEQRAAVAAHREREARAAEARKLAADEAAWARVEARRKAEAQDG